MGGRRGFRAGGRRVLVCSFSVLVLVLVLVIVAVAAAAAVAAAVAAVMVRVGVAAVCKARMPGKCSHTPVRATYRFLGPLPQPMSWSMTSKSAAV